MMTCGACPAFGDNRATLVVEPVGWPGQGDSGLLGSLADRLRVGCQPSGMGRLRSQPAVRNTVSWKPPGVDSTSFREAMSRRAACGTLRGR